MTALEARFWRSVDKHTPAKCWEWTSAKSATGYGIFTFANRQYRATKYSYELHHGLLPDGLCVCHKCDNPPCVNPQHLWAGTASDNALDRGIKLALRKCKDRRYPRAATRYGYRHLAELVSRVRPEMEDILLAEVREILPALNLAKLINFFYLEREPVYLKSVDKRGRVGGHMSKNLHFLYIYP